MYVWVVDDQIRNLDIQQRYMDKPNANKISQRLQRVKAGVGSIQNIPAILRYLRPYACFQRLRMFNAFRERRSSIRRAGRLAIE